MEQLARDGTESELAEAQTIACAMADAMPKSIHPSMAVGVVGLLLQSTFMTCIKAEYRLAAFDDFAKRCREQIERGCR
jgi:hypothetical protein